jgi:hypothetical protein
LTEGLFFPQEAGRPLADFFSHSRPVPVPGPRLGGGGTVAEQIDEKAMPKIPQIVWAESTSFIVPVYSLVYCQPPYEIHILVNTALVLFSWSLQYVPENYEINKKSDIMPPNQKKTLRAEM